MLKYVDTKVTFAEIPNEITLCINFSNCPFKCKGCHSDYLQQDVGKEFNLDVLNTLLKHNRGVTCICFMGGDNDCYMINYYASVIKAKTSLFTAWYSGREYIHKDINLHNFDYIKLGPYIEGLGGLQSNNTNQKLYRIKDITCQIKNRGK